MGVVERLILGDEQWERISHHIVGDERTRGLSGRDNRMFVEAVLWIVRTGSPWRDLPDIFGEWNSVFRRFSRWSPKGVWWRMFAVMSDDPDFEYLIVDSTIIRAHQHAAGENVWPAPLQALIGDRLNSLHKRIRHVGGKAAAKMEIRASGSS